MGSKGGKSKKNNHSNGFNKSRNNQQYFSGGSFNQQNAKNDSQSKGYTPSVRGIKR